MSEGSEMSRGATAIKARALVAAALETIEGVDDPAPQRVDLRDAALLLVEALKLLDEGFGARA
jgi:hypothetical protein